MLWYDPVLNGGAGKLSGYVTANNYLTHLTQYTLDVENLHIIVRITGLKTAVFIIYLISL